MDGSAGTPVVAATLLLLAGCVSFRDMRAKNAYLKGDIDTAEALTESSLQSDPSDLQARKLGAKIATRRGADALDRGELAVARGYFQKAVNLYPADDVCRELPRHDQAGRSDSVK